MSSKPLIQMVSLTKTRERERERESMGYLHLIQISIDDLNRK